MHTFKDLVKYLEEEIEVYVPCQIKDKTYILMGTVIQVQKIGPCVVWLSDSITTIRICTSKIFLDRTNCRAYLKKGVRKKIFEIIFNFW